MVPAGGGGGGGGEKGVDEKEYKPFTDVPVQPDSFWF